MTKIKKTKERNSTLTLSLPIKIIYKLEKIAIKKNTSISKIVSKLLDKKVSDNEEIN